MQLRVKTGYIATRNGRYCLALTVMHDSLSSCHSKQKDITDRCQNTGTFTTILCYMVNLFADGSWIWAVAMLQTSLLLLQVPNCTHPPAETLLVYESACESIRQSLQMPDRTNHQHVSHVTDVLQSSKDTKDTILDAVTMVLET